MKINIQITGDLYYVLTSREMDVEVLQKIYIEIEFAKRKYNESI